MDNPDPVRQCESLEECQVLYQSIPDQQKAPALAFLRDRLSTQAEEIRRRHAANPDTWWAIGHFGWGMAIRNALRTAGFGETYFHIANLDDIVYALIEEALGLGAEGKT
jgi:hypothetical protein